MITADRVKQFFIYLLGLFFLSLGISFSIRAGLGVSAVSSLPYAVTLTTGITVGVTTVALNVFYYMVQVILSKSFKIKSFLIQIVVAFIFGFFLDITLPLVSLLYDPETVAARIVFLVISLFFISVGLFGYFTSKLPLMPYDALTYVVSQKFHMVFSRAKITCDLLNVCISGALCLIFVRSFGSIGFGTVAAAYFVGKLLGGMIKYFQQPLVNYIHAKSLS